MSTNIDQGIMCIPVEQTTITSFTVELFEHGGTLRARWDSNTDVEPNYATLFLYLGDENGRNEKVRAEHKTGQRKGEHDFGINPGTGFRLALMANDFAGKKVELVSTEPELPKVTKEYSFKLVLENSDGKAKLTWSSNAAFRPRESRYRLYEEGGEKHGDWINEQNGSKTFQDVRWGVNLSAAYTAEGYGHKPPRHELVRTPTTKA